jgi:hypothetical protein
MTVAPPRGSFKIVRQVTIGVDELKKIADALGIPEAEAHLISGHIYVGTTPSQPSGGTPPSPSSGATPPSAPTGGTPPSPPSARTP